MCFSATASFAAAAVLTPLGGVALARAWRTDRRHLALAAFPALFGLQQLFEGVLWLGLEDPAAPVPLGAAMAFLAFAYVLWPVLTPFAAFLVEPRPRLRRLFLGAAIFGGLYGLSLFAPLALDPDWLRVELARNSIVYDTRLIYDDLVPRNVLRVIYAAVICLPLLACAAPGVRTFGVLVTVSVAAAFLFAAHAFTSVWCFFAAATSAYVTVTTFRLPPRAPGRSGPPARPAA